MRRYCGWHNSITSRKPRFLCVPKGGIELRWFTTLTEVNLCGHATLAAAYILFNELDYPDSRLHFDTASGRLTVSREGDWMTLDFPACPTQAQTPPPELLTALGITRYVEARKGRASGAGTGEPRAGGSH